MGFADWKPVWAPQDDDGADSPDHDPIDDTFVMPLPDPPPDTAAPPPAGSAPPPPAGSAPPPPERVAAVEEVDRALSDPDAPPGSIVEAPAEPLPDIIATAPLDASSRRQLEDDLLRQRASALSDLGGLAVEMARRERMRVDLLASRAAIVLRMDAELDMLRATAAQPAASAEAEPVVTAIGVCRVCGSTLPADANYCPSCGSSALVDPQEAAAK
jgi:ribosomal protein L40E